MPCRSGISRTLVVVFAVCTSAGSAFAADQQWSRVSSDHFVVLTDAGEKKGHEVAARFEQMRAMFGDLLVRRKVRMAEPIDIIAIRSDKDYAALAPLVNGQPTKTPAFFLPGEDRIFIVLNLFEVDSWRPVEHQLAHYFLEYNYPPTQPWFDEGFAEYFSSLFLTSKQAELGSDPELTAAYQTDLLGEETQTNGLKSFTEILSNPVWLTLPDLFGMKNRVVNGQEGTHRTLFFAQSWILMHYLLNKGKLSEAGTYFDLVENQKLHVEQAVQQAFGMTVVQLDQALKDYFYSLKPLFDALDASKQTAAPMPPQSVDQVPLPFSVDDVGTSVKPVPLAEAQALVNEMELRIPERREQALQKLNALIADPKTETIVAHRALAWLYVQKGDSDPAYEELTTAMQMSASDPWVRFELAQASYRSGEKGARIQGLANMMESLQIVLDEFPEFAEAYNMLGWARLAGGGGNSALEAMRMAVQLNPRNEQYQLRLAKAFVAAKKWDDATATLERLKLSPNPQIAHAAKKDLTDMPFLRKFGVPPQEEPEVKESASATPKPEKASKDKDDDEDTSTPAPPPAAPEIDKRLIRFLKTTLVAVDCSQAPTAVLTVLEGNKTLKLRAADYKSLTVIGNQEFSCEWKNLAVNVNYKRGGKLDGDLVSVEVR